MNRPAPLTTGGRQTLVYLIFAGSGPALTVLIIWAMSTIRDWQDAAPADKLARFAFLAEFVAVALLILVVALACFVSIRAIKVGKDGLEATSQNAGDDGAKVTATAQVTVSPAPPPPPVDGDAGSN